MSSPTEASEFMKFNHPPPPAVSVDGTLLEPPPLPLIFSRIYVRWIPDLAKEPTSSLRLISPSNRYVDLSIVFSTPTPPPQQQQSRHASPKTKSRASPKGKGKQTASRSSPSAFEPSSSSITSASEPVNAKATLVSFSAGTYYRTQHSGLRGHLVDSSTPLNQLSHHYHSISHHANGDVLHSGKFEYMVAEQTPVDPMTLSSADRMKYGFYASSSHVSGGMPPTLYQTTTRRVVKRYEELWRPWEVDPRWGRVAVVLLLQNENIAVSGVGIGGFVENGIGYAGHLPTGMGAKGMVVRVGGWCQGILQSAKGVVAERWARGDDARWKRVCRVEWSAEQQADSETKNVSYTDDGQEVYPEFEHFEGEPLGSKGKGNGKGKGKEKARDKGKGKGKARLPDIKEEESEIEEQKQGEQDEENPMKNVVLPCSVACMDRDESQDATEWQGARYWKAAKGAGFAVEKTVKVGDMVVVGGMRWEVIERCQW